jgi:hypothetical protein
MEENDANNFQILTLEQLDNLQRKFKKNKRITIDLTGILFEKAQNMIFCKKFRKNSIGMLMKKLTLNNGI